MEVWRGAIVSKIDVADILLAQAREFTGSEDRNNTLSIILD